MPACTEKRILPALAFIAAHVVFIPPIRIQGIRENSRNKLTNNQSNL